MKNLVLCSLMLLMLGCGGRGGTAVKGKVTFSDGSPLTKGVVVFVGKPGTFQAAIQSDGSYSLEHVQPGEYSVAITGVYEGDSQPGEMKYDDQGNYIPDDTPPPKLLIDEKYTNPEMSGIRKTVPGDYAIQIEKRE